MKEWIANLFRQPDELRFPVVWPTEQRAIYGWLAQWSEEAGTLPEAAQILPDEAALAEDENRLRWAGGAQDGAFGHHIMSGDGKEKAAQVTKAIVSVLRRSSRKNMQTLYQLLNEGTPLNYIDDLLEALGQAAIDPQRLRALALFLATKAPDRQAIKCAMALLAFFPCQQSVNILQVLGSHDEFTLYAVVAMRSILPPDEFKQEWLTLVKRVTGWGRIQLIEQLPDEPDEAIHQWLLREGYANDVMVEYTAWHCAEYGRLHEALEGEVDVQILTGAAEILRGMLNGQPGRHISEYQFAALACERYLAHVAPTGPADLLHYLVVEEIDRQVGEEAFATEAEWQTLKVLCTAILARPEWSMLTEAGLREDDVMIFDTALQIYRGQGGDPWPAVYQRYRTKPENWLWYQLMRTDNPDYVAQVIALAENELDLAAIASGPRKSLGMGPQYQQHDALGSVLQDLNRFPGQGWTLIRTGLQSPVTRNRHMALNALEAWPTVSLPTEAVALLKEASSQEPEKEVKERLKQLLEQHVEKP